MNVFKSLAALPPFQNTVVTIGSFDGVHQGHQVILSKVKELAKSIGGQSVVITFEPHPRLVLQPNDHSLRLLSTADEKAHLLQGYGIENVVIVPFSKEFSEQSPEDYILHFLHQYFRPHYIVVGYDHRFGTKRAGDTDFLRQYEPKLGFEVIEIEKQLIEEISVSSTKIRKALEAADIVSANRLLGHRYSFRGVVVKGQQIGKTIGFPTANIAINSPYKLVPPFGIYAVGVIIDGKKHSGMLYRGDRPVLSEYDNITIEVNIFDFNEDIYGKTIEVFLIDFVRPDKKIDSLEALQVQLKEDEIEIRKILKEDFKQGISIA